MIAYETPIPSELLARYARPVPRYTSYPTAPHFRSEIGARSYRAWLEALGAKRPLSLYIHIPFCRSLCWFCGCTTRVANDQGPLERYLAFLLAEIEMVADAIGGRPAVTHLHLGGGTPTSLTSDELKRLVAALERRFDLRALGEFAIEIDPRVLTDDQAEALVAMGVTRASLGVQDFSPRVQEAINRIQSFAVTARAASVLRHHGVASLNIDLLYGLPHQTAESVVATVERTLTLSPDRLAIFGYAHVPWLKRHQRLIPEETLPGPAERFRQASAAAAALRAHGFIPIGIDHFARPGDAMVDALAEGKLHRNFQGYTTDRAPTLIGLGVSAIGSLPQGYAQNASDFVAYAGAVGNGQLATVRGIAIDDDDRLRRDIIEALMCRFEAPVERLREAYGEAPGYFADAYERLAPIEAEGLVAITDGRVLVTELGRPFVRTIATVFDRYFAAGEGRHSIAV